MGSVWLKIMNMILLPLTHLNSLSKTYSAYDLSQKNHLITDVCFSTLPTAILLPNSSSTAGAARALTQTLRIVCLFTSWPPPSQSARSCLDTTLPQGVDLRSGIWLIYHKRCWLLPCIGEAGCHNNLGSIHHPIHFSLPKLLLPCSLWLSHPPHYAVSHIFGQLLWQQMHTAAVTANANSCDCQSLTATFLGPVRTYHPNKHF